MLRVQLITVCLLSFVPSTGGKHIQYVVEEEHRQNKPHLHPLRKPGKVVSPYKSAASITTHSKSDRYETFSLNCPHVTAAASNDVNLEVAWTMNDTVWLKIENGQHTVANKLSTFTKKTVSGKSVLRVMLNSGRYFFDYDELTGEFSMEIHPVSIAEDVGIWQCHVTVYQQDNTYTLTSRSRVKVARVHRHEEDRKTPALPTAQSEIVMMDRSKNDVRSVRGKTSSFSRGDDTFVHINRDDSIKYNQVIFNRQSPLRPPKIVKVMPDYDDESVGDYPRSRVRSLPRKSTCIFTALHSIFVHALFYLFVQL